MTLKALVRHENGDLNKIAIALITAAMIGIGSFWTVGSVKAYTTETKVTDMNDNIKRILDILEHRQNRDAKKEHDSRNANTPKVVG